MCNTRIEKKKKKEKHTKQNIANKISENVNIDFDSGYEPKEILGVTDVGGTKRFLLKWHGLEEATFVLAEKAHKACPDLVINFYESILKFEDTK
ncbi:hypothetical protein PGB90_004854 [Kerria lacca]